MNMGKTFIAGSTRRGFLGSAITVGPLVAVGAVKSAAGARSLRLSAGDVILFQGDSITDAGRNRKNNEANDRAGMGGGYPCSLAGALLAEYPRLRLRVYNRGISGNRVPDLAARWQTDAVDLKPKILSILIGVNDIWHKLNGRSQGTVADYENGCRALLKETLEKIPGVQIVVCEPFVLRCGAVTEAWFPEFDERRAVAKKLASEFKLTFVPFQSMFDDAVKQAPPDYWAADGVHPTLAGHALMAARWRKVTQL